VGGNYQAIAVYADAAEWYERFAKESPDQPEASTALSDAVVLRLGLGQVDKAMADAKAFNDRYGARQPAEAAQIAFAIGAHDVERGDWRNAERRLSGAMRQIESRATLELQLQAEATLARAYVRLGQSARAAELYGKVRDAWKDPAASRARIVRLGGSEDEQARRLGKALSAVGEALFFFAERRRAQVETLEFPAYHGSGERRDVERHIATKVKQWKERKDVAIREAEREYLRILDLDPPPPQWVIAAGAAVGKVWGRYVAEFRAAPYPKEWDQPGASPYGDPNDPSAPPLLWSEIRAEYLRWLDEASENEKRKAKAAYEKCLSYSVKYMYFDQDSRSCEKWLSGSYPGQYHLIDELRDQATRTGSGLDERAQPLDRQGAPLSAATGACGAASPTAACAASPTAACAASATAARAARTGRAAVAEPGMAGDLTDAEARRGSGAARGPGAPRAALRGRSAPASVSRQAVVVGRAAAAGWLRALPNAEGLPAVVDQVAAETEVGVAGLLGDQITVVRGRAPADVAGVVDAEKADAVAWAGAHVEVTEGQAALGGWIGAVAARSGHAEWRGGRA
jgi:tetratricopeptide (TPR) repeat protein